METNSHILFCSHQPDKIGAYMSNFWPCTFTDPNGITYNCSEQYFMLAKALLFDKNNTTLINKILVETDPIKIRAFGRKVRNYNQAIWDQHKTQKMFEANWYKFTQNEDLKLALINTNKILIEAASYDSIWGAGLTARQIVNNNYQFNGENLLGQILMDVRSRLTA